MKTVETRKIGLQTSWATLCPSSAKMDEGFPLFSVFFPASVKPKAKEMYEKT
jgi:hypothetical protein